MLRIVLIRPGLTDFDEQGRIKGNLDIPLNDGGNEQIRLLSDALADHSIEVLYSAPCQAADETCAVLADMLKIRAKRMSNMRNLDHGLWQGKRIDEVKDQQRKVYRQWQEQPETVCPPAGEMIGEARDRVRTALEKLLKKHKSGVIALVVPEPLATLVRCELQQGELGDLWQAERECGSWELIDVIPDSLVPSLVS